MGSLATGATVITLILQYCATILKFSKSYLVYTKKVPKFEIVWPTPATLRALTVKGVYVVSNNCYVHQYELVCMLV